jgi:cyclopropane fatty-acyl-phospholipid synthase-like methyltransferase
MTESDDLRDAIRADYEQLPYPKLAFSFSHPAQLAAMARLYGLQAPPLQRILDVGCGSGANLLWIAKSLPETECLGIDLSENQLDEARRDAAAAVTNARLQRADLMDFDAGAERFDYIIAYGFFGWVPDAVKTRLLDFCRHRPRRLGPEGYSMGDICIFIMSRFAFDPGRPVPWMGTIM